MMFGWIELAVLTGSKVHPNTRTVYLLGHTVDPSDSSLLYPSAIKGELQSTDSDGI